MAVLSRMREDSELKVLTLAYNLSTYTLKKVRSEKYFPKNQRWLLAKRVADSVLDALKYIQSANECPTRTKEDFAIRRECQIKAHMALQTLLQMIRLTDSIYSINGNVLEYWTSFAEETDVKVKSWMKSDLDRFSKF